MTIVKRSTKGTALTYVEMDENIRDLYEDTTIDRVLENGNTTTRNLIVGSLNATNITVAGQPLGLQITWEIKTTNFNAVNKHGYFVDTTLGAITATLPSSATLGDEITFNDGNQTFDTNNFTVARNGHKIQGLEEDLTVSIENAGLTLVYYNVEMGWKLKNK